MTMLNFDSGDLEETEAFLAASYTRIRIAGRARDTRTRIVQNSAGAVSVDRCDLNYDMAFRAEALGRVCLVSLHTGTLVTRTGGKEELFGPGETFLLVPPDVPYSGEARTARYTLALFDPALLTQTAAIGAAHPPGPVRLTGQRAVTPLAGAQLRSTLAFLRDDVLARPAARTAPLVVGNATRLLAASVLAALPNSAATDPVPMDGRDGSPSTLRRAIAYIEDNAHRDISLADIAASVPVTPRALQYAFRRHAHTTPLGHLRDVRLALAHAELKAAAPHDGTTVTGVAMRWGFAHPGRFAALHRARYGVPPGVMLRA